MYTISTMLMVSIMLGTLSLMIAQYNYEYEKTKNEIMSLSYSIILTVLEVVFSLIMVLVAHYFNLF